MNSLTGTARVQALLRVLGETGPHAAESVADHSDLPDDILAVARDYWARHEEETTHLL